MDQQQGVDQDWPTNYFNYFTEIEERFQRARGTSLFLLSPLDWALIATWKNGGIPLEAVLAGIDSAFEKWRARNKPARQVNSLAYCAQAVQETAKALSAQDTGQPRSKPKDADAPFTVEALAQYLSDNGRALQQSPHASIQAIGSQLIALSDDAAQQMLDLEALEQRMTALEEKMLAQLRLAHDDEALLRARQELETQLRPYRSKMSGEQLKQLEEQYLSRKLLESSALPRLSLFYMTEFGG